MQYAIQFATKCAHFNTLLLQEATAAHKAALDAADAAREAAEQLAERYRQQAEAAAAAAASGALGGALPGTPAPPSVPPRGRPSPGVPGGDAALQFAGLTPSQAAAAMSAEGKGLADVYAMYVEMVSHGAAARRIGLRRWLATWLCRLYSAIGVKDC